jgi:hypothetical protein
MTLARFESSVSGPVASDRCAAAARPGAGLSAPPNGDGARDAVQASACLRRKLPAARGSHPRSRHRSSGLASCAGSSDGSIGWSSGLWMRPRGGEGIHCHNVLIDRPGVRVGIDSAAVHFTAHGEARAQEVVPCGERDLNPRTPTRPDPESGAFGQAGRSPREAYSSAAPYESSESRTTSFRAAKRTASRSRRWTRGGRSRW